MCLCSVLVEDSKEAEELKSAYLDYRRLKESKMKTTIVMRRSMRNFNTPSPGNSSGNLNLNIGPFKLSPAQAKILFKHPT